ncbi:ATP-binding protein phnN [Ramlibacter tataouinensis]|uniref:Ribose 1,5-bisphosphate phosphokinase PhnN n=1 Tax=Ramlibacter tataouinensis (strain ATCC BAA-407 / DSM 14655 / LMG 21543 / TTB310) TaxID=365046 RepID=F5XZY7_RAMTT|nr:ATP-binding protein phnN [Ramlibacter tataouinensis]AEG93348.1 Candidate ATP-binding protein phnN [Ramlibacter tataouinensis TTB310]
MKQGRAPSGCWVMACGPSGAGKDSLLAWAEAALAREPRIVFARRLVTRATHPGSDHDEVSPAAMRALGESGGLAWHWEAHGHQYGVRAAYADLVAQGRIVVVNGSREHVAGLAGRADVRSVLITAPAEALRQRLLARGREPAQAVAGRLHRNAALPALAADLVLVNDGPLERAAGALRDWLRELAA